jgi:predicted nucleotide-binding protein (sugar kinase/HSP70/actin superfamily)
MIMKKEKLIKKIQQVLDDLGTRSINVHELDTESSINIGDLANGDITECVETLRYDDVSTTVYHNGNEIEWSDKDYQDLKLETLEEILEALQYYKIGFDKTLDVIRDEDF